MRIINDFRTHNMAAAIHLVINMKPLSGTGWNSVGGDMKTTKHRLRHSVGDWEEGVLVEESPQMGSGPGRDEPRWSSRRWQIDSMTNNFCLILPASLGHKIFNFINL